MMMESFGKVGPAPDVFNMLSSVTRSANAFLLASVETLTNSPFC